MELLQLFALCRSQEPSTGVGGEVDDRVEGVAPVTASSRIAIGRLYDDERHFSNPQGTNPNLVKDVIHH
jgi:hypothetical protein